MAASGLVVPAQAGIHFRPINLDPRLRRDDACVVAPAHFDN
jgi:hypothetical protein